MVKTELQRQSMLMSTMMVGYKPLTYTPRHRLQHVAGLADMLVQGLLMKPARYGAYTQLFAALSPDVTPLHNGAFIIPWGRFGVLPDHIEQEIKPTGHQETGISQQFWDYCEAATAGF